MALNVPDCTILQLHLFLRNIRDPFAEEGYHFCTFRRHFSFPLASHEDRPYPSLQLVTLCRPEYKFSDIYVNY